MSIEETNRFTKRSNSDENISMIERGFRWLKTTNENWQEKRFLKNRMKILVAGLPLSGKTTFLNQLRAQTSYGFSDHVVTTATAVIEDIVLTALDKLVEILALEGSDTAMPHFHELLQTYQTGRKNMDTLELLKQTIVQILIYPVVEDVTRNHYFEFPRNFRYFLDSIDRISNQEYIPSSSDIIRAPIPSSEIEEVWIVIRRNPYVLTALSGARLLSSVRSMGYFADSASIVFIVFLDRFEVDLKRTFEIFEEIAKVSYLKKAAFMFLLNKSRDFSKKIRTLKFSDYFPDFVGRSVENSYSLEEKIEKYVKDRLIRSLLKSQVHYTHVTDIVSTFNTTDFHNCIKSSVLSFNLSNYYFV